MLRTTIKTLLVRLSQVKLIITFILLYIQSIQVIECCPLVKVQTSSSFQISEI